uniref:Interleukin 13 receptor, alpha 2 n=1 Tax=Myripristis murdjan TaxID=586833 RepID=A0A667X528_9TELE
MTGNVWLSIRATLMLFLLFVWLSHFIQCFLSLAVDPPENLTILDPGHLGSLQIHWSPPASLLNMKDCHKRFQLEYFNTYEDQWTIIRTSKRTYSAQFDLGKQVQVRVYTLLKGSCTNGSEVKSARYTELIKEPTSTGESSNLIQDFVCVFHRMEYVECKWERDPKQPANSLPTLYFWHNELEQTEECPKYIISNGIRSGCTFTGKSLPDFTDINFCVNGSSPEGPMKPSFITLQIQNHVKPAATQILQLQARPDTQLELSWESPAGKVPKNCLEWEVEHSEEGPDGNHLSVRLQESAVLNTCFYLRKLINSRICVRVRSKMHKYCANEGFWSDWSVWTCYPGNVFFFFFSLCLPIHEELTVKTTTTTTTTKKTGRTKAKPVLPPLQVKSSMKLISTPGVDQSEVMKAFIFKACT